MSDSDNGNREHLNPASTVTAVVTRRSEGVLQVLLTLRAIEPFKDMWCLPGGHIDQFEKSYKAVVREVQEETGLRFNGEYLGTFDEIFVDLGIHNVVSAYAGNAAGEPVRQESEVREMRWVPLDQAREMKLAFANDKVLDAFVRWSHTRNCDGAKDGLLEEFRALRGEMTCIFNARLWGTATYLLLVLGVVGGLGGDLQPFHWLFLLYASIPFVLHTAYRERARIRAGVYIKEKIEPYIRGLDWEHFVDEWRCSLGRSEQKPIIDRVLHMIGIGGLYVLVMAVATTKCITEALKPWTPFDFWTAAVLILCFLGLILAGMALANFFSLYRRMEDKSRDVSTRFSRNPPVY